MRASFRPATALVGRRRYAQKFAVVGMVPQGFVAKAYVDINQEQINLSAGERAGVAYLVPLVELITSLASMLGLHVVAEGAETAAQVSDLRRLGCDVVQGYFFGRPLPSKEAWDTVRAVPERLLAAALGEIDLRDVHLDLRQCALLAQARGAVVDGSVRSCIHSPGGTGST